MSPNLQANPELMLVAVAGPELVSRQLDPALSYTIGRRGSHSVPLMHPEVSKDHASISFRADRAPGAWFITDLGSRHGTRLNGVALDPNRETPVMPGDLVSIDPWTFCLLDQSKSSGHGSRLCTVDDALVSGSTVSAIHADGGGRELAQERLRLLLRCAESLQRATSVESLAEIVLEAAMAGTGYPNAAVTRPMTPDSQVELIVGRGQIVRAGDAPRLSRSLIRSASQGVPALLFGSELSGSIRKAVSIAEFGIQEAICVPLMVESTVAGFLYLDNRVHQAQASSVAADEARAFAVGIGRLASMAWSNLMRMELGQRYAFMEGELKAAAEAQRTILPEREGCCGSLRYIGECRPGRVVSGDFFDVIPLPGNRVAVAVGDVSGKGISASVLMTTAVGLLNGALRQSIFISSASNAGNVAAAVHELSRYVHDRAAGGRFLTLWLGLFDMESRTLSYVDAGHGYALMIESDGAVQRLNECGGSAVGTEENACYEPAIVPLKTGGRVFVVSDGIIEQPAPSKAGARDEFGTKRLQHCLVSGLKGSDEVSELFKAVQKHAGGPDLADDATVVVVRW